MKTCTICKESKPKTEYYSKTGQCKPCFKARINARRQANPEPHREWNRKRQANLTDADKDRQRDYWRIYRRANPPSKKQQYARNQARALPKDVLCKYCGTYGALEAHHRNYDKPLDVQWLCVPCHKQWHVTNGPGLNG